MIITIVAMCLSSTYRVIHATTILCKVFSNKLYDQFAIGFPLTIVLFTATNYGFQFYIYQSLMGVTWSELELNLLFGLCFGLLMIFKWIQAFQYLEVAVAIPSVFTSIQIDDYLKVKEKDADQSVLNNNRDSTGKFDFDNYMEALKEHKRKKKRYDCILMMTNLTVFALIIGATVWSVFNPLVLVYTFLVVLTSTWIMDIICLRRIQSHMKKLGHGLPDKNKIVAT